MPSIFTPEQRWIAKKIGEFYLDKNNGDHEKANEEISRVRFNHVEFLNDNRVLLEVSRPGILIGKRGENIEKLQEFLGHKLYIKETVEHIMDHMYVYPVEDDYDAFLDLIMEEDDNG